jgi:hypothetical protein
VVAVGQDQRGKLLASDPVEKHFDPSLGRGTATLLTTEWAKVVEGEAAAFV